MLPLSKSKTSLTVKRIALFTLYFLFFFLQESTEIVNEIDVIWLKKGTNQINSLFEVEHSTPIYSGLLRFNDFFLVTKEKKLKFNIVSNDERRSLFTKQINRPTFQVSGLGETCNFLEYKDVFGWFERTKSIK